ncbi:PAS domain S-box protein [Halobaculum halobium]|uniref:PAS domain S-box protein n=1 Tax=Halobaculum halobium TaxID=3032281 RepID=UPI003609FA43
MKFDASLECCGLDEAAAAVLGIDPSGVTADILPQLSPSPATTRETLEAVVETKRPATIEWAAQTTEQSGLGWAVPDGDGVAVLLVVDETATAAASGTGIRPRSEESGPTDTGPESKSRTPSNEAEARTTETLLDHTESLAGTGGWEYDIESDALVWTAGTRRIHGVDSEFEPTVEKALSFYHPDHREEIQTAVRRAIEDGAAYDTEAQILTNGGTRRLVRTIGHPIKQDGEVVVVRGAIQDITDSRDQQRQIALLQRAIDAAPVGVTLADVRQENEPLVYVNEAFEKLTGYSISEAVGRNCRFLQGPETTSATVSTLRDAIEAEESATVTIRNYRADGTPFWNRLTIAPVTNADGRVTHYVGFQTDVSEQKATESRLQGFERAVDQSGHAIYITDLDGTITYVNRSFEELTGYEYDDAVGRTPNILSSGQMGEEYFDRLWRTITSGETFEERIIDKDSDGHHYRAHQTISPLIDDGDVVGFVAVQIDITDQIERAQQVAVLDRVLRHNLRNDMNVILGHAGRIERATDGDVAESASTITATSERLLDLVRKERAVVKQFSAPDDIRSHDVRSVLRSALTDLRETHPSAEVSVDCPAGLTVDATPQIEDALAECIENAIEHTDDAVPTVTIVAASDAGGTETGADTVRISIADRGPGVPESIKELVTTHQIPDSLTHTDGIGLWLANWIVTRSGGSIEFEDRDGGGTVVHVRLPLAGVSE